VYQPARDVAKGEASDHRHERLLVDLTRCSLDRVTPGSQQIVGDIACLGQGLPSGLLNSFARFPNRPSAWAVAAAVAEVAFRTPSPTASPAWVTPD
jgi:hypothetical protein